MRADAFGVNIRSATHYPQSRILAQTITSSSLIGTPNCVPWRKPFVVPVGQACLSIPASRSRLNHIYDGLMNRCPALGAGDDVELPVARSLETRETA